MEALYGDTRELDFQVEVTEARGADRNVRGRALEEMRLARAALASRALELLEALDPEVYGGDDRRAIALMRRTLARLGTSALDDPGESVRLAGAGAEATAAERCRYDPAALLSGPDGFSALRGRMYDCYGVAAARLATPDDTTDRLSILARLATEESPERRRALFLSLRPVWESINGDRSASSPYRTLLRASAERWRREGSPLQEGARSLGLDPAAVESTLVQILSAWRDHTPAQPVEPWDWFHTNGEVSRLLSGRLPLDALRTVNDGFYRDQGADPTALGIRYDLEPRPGKTPVAFAQFGRPARARGGRFGESEVWVFATYRAGGFDNLVELLHETGHAIHLSGIATRPAFADWPDSDPYTEALGDLLALEAYEPEWQQRYLGAAAPVGASLRAKYASIALDAAWALLELRLHRDPVVDPDDEWRQITGDFLRIVPHPEWSWWAMRGQLVESPGYMANYPLGAIAAAALRARVRTQRGPFSRPDRGMYDWLGGRLYRWGAQRPAREVLEDVLGAPVSAQALLADMARLKG